MPPGSGGPAARPGRRRFRDRRRFLRVSRFLRVRRCLRVRRARPCHRVRRGRPCLAGRPGRAAPRRPAQCCTAQHCPEQYCPAQCRPAGPRARRARLAGLGSAVRRDDQDAAERRRPPGDRAAPYRARASPVLGHEQHVASQQKVPRRLRCVTSCARVTPLNICKPGKPLARSPAPGDTMCPIRLTLRRVAARRSATTPDSGSPRTARSRQRTCRTGWILRSAATLEPTTFNDRHQIIGILDYSRLN